MEDANSSESVQNNGSCPMAFRKMMKKEVEVMVTVKGAVESVGPIVQLLQKVVKEDTQLAQEWSSLHHNRNLVDEATTSRSRTLELKFPDEVSASVFTGQEIKGKEGNNIKIYLLDVNGHTVISGPEASAEVEILILEAGPNDNICNMSRIEFNNSIIRENNKAKPYFRKPLFVSLEEGIGVLSNVRLANGSHHTKNCKCRLGARVVDAFDGIIVKEARTNSFMVRDCRCQYKEKHHPPELHDPPWRLEHIGKDGAPCRRLHEAKIDTVQKFLFSLNIDPQIPRRMMFRTSDKTWSTIVAHARQCSFDDTQIHFYSPSTEYKTGVVFDAVGQLKGLIHNHQFVPIESVAESEKEEARKLLASAFENWNDITSLDENSFWHHFPPSSNASRLDSPDHNHIMDEFNVVYDPTESQGIGLSFNHTNGSSHFGLLVSNENTADAQERVPVSYMSFDSIEGFLSADLADEFIVFDNSFDPLS